MVKKICHPLGMLLLMALISSLFSLPSSATNEELPRYYMGSAVHAGKDDGYNKITTISTEDFHYGWDLGEFYMEDFTRVITDDPGNPVFLKTVGDTVTLRFKLLQDIDKLNGNENYAIETDSNGKDIYFQIPQTNFGRGTLIIRHTDYQNHKGEPTVYTDYLAALTMGADVEVQCLEEGDYEVALNYEIVKKGWLGMNIYDNYRIFFTFSVRNGNCMVYPFDTQTGDELTNTAFTENGFRLDLARSRYLDIDIKKSVMNEGRDGLVEDVRFNKPARDGEEYTDEGIYTITVSNRYTKQETVKKIYIGSDKVLKAHVTTGLSVADINEHLAKGGDIAEDGTLVPLEGNFEGNANITPPNSAGGNETAKNNSGTTIIISLVVIFVLAGTIIFFGKCRKAR